MTTLESLADLARKATPGPFPSVSSCDCDDCRFSRVLSPEFVLALIECVRAADAALLASSYVGVSAQYRTARAALARLEGGK